MMLKKRRKRKPQAPSHEQQAETWRCETSVETGMKEDGMEGRQVQPQALHACQQIAHRQRL